MRKLRRSTPLEIRGSSREPMAEGVIPLDQRGRKRWSAVSDEELIDFAKLFLMESGITSRSQLFKACRPLHWVLSKRELFADVELNEKQKNWAAMSDEELVKHTKKFIAENDIDGRAGLQKIAYGLYRALRKRELLDSVGLKPKLRDWRGMNDKELVSHAKRFIKDRNIRWKKELEDADPGLYQVLVHNGIIDSVGLGKKRRQKRKWSVMSDNEIVDYVENLMRMGKIASKNDLNIADSGAYTILRKRGLLDQVFSQIEEQKDSSGLHEISEAMGEFGGEE